MINSLNDKKIEIQKKGKVTIITTIKNKYVIKESNKDNKFYEYLISRNFNYFPESYYNEEKIVMEYIIEKDTPLEQKLEDMVYLISILHNNTMFDKKVDLDFTKEIYETLTVKQDYLLNFYQNMQNTIEEEMYMSPSNYLLIRNISLIYLAINYSKKYLNEFYNIAKDNSSFRYSYIHGNLNINHILESDKIYLISWDKSRLDFPIYDLLDLYKKNFNNISLKDILAIYEKKIILKKEEKYLLISLLLLPDEISYNIEEYTRTKQVSNMIFYLEGIVKYLENNSNKTNNNTNK